MNKMRAYLSIAAAFILSAITVAGAEQPGIPVARRPTLMCIYHFMKAQSVVQSVGIYEVDGFRSAIEYTFRIPNNSVVSSDLILFGNAPMSGGYAYDITSEGNDSQKIADEKWGFLGPISDELASTCHLVPVLDDMLPGPPSERLWRRVDLATWTTTSK